MTASLTAKNTLALDLLPRFKGRNRVQHLRGTLAQSPPGRPWSGLQPTAWASVWCQCTDSAQGPATVLSVPSVPAQVRLSAANPR